MIEKSLAWTRKYPARVRVLDVNVGISIPFTGQRTPGIDIVQCNLIWDTGASGSVITPSVAKKLGLQPIDKMEVHTAGGSGIKNVYLVNFFLPNGAIIQNVRVTEADLTSQGLDGLIGMDVIGLGDFSVTHAEGKTVVTYRLPSCTEIDYVKEYNDHMASKTQVIAAPVAG